MKLSRASTYAFYGLSYIATQPKGRYVPLSEIHQHYGVPEKHLAKIFQAFVKAGVLASARGVHGGFALLKDPSEVSALDVIEIVEGPIPRSGCLLLQELCEIEQGCQVNSVWRRAQQAMLKVLEETDLSNMLQVPRPRAEGLLQVTSRRTA